MTLQTSLLYHLYEIVLKRDLGNQRKGILPHLKIELKQLNETRFLKKKEASHYWKEPENNPLGRGNYPESCLLIEKLYYIISNHIPNLESVNPYDF